MVFLDRLKLGWEILTKLEPEIQNHPDSMQKPAQRVDGESETMVALSRPAYLDEIGPLPPYSIVVGQCEDGAPLFLDLSDPRPGSILIAGDANSGKTRLLEGILISASLLNPPRRMQYALLSPDLSGYSSLVGRPHTHWSCAIDSDEAIEIILELADIVEQRRQSRQLGTALILAVDGLYQLAQQLDEEMLAQFIWLVQNGPKVRIWPIITVRSDDVAMIDVNLISSFGTRLLGKIASPEQAELLGGGDAAQASALVAGTEFAALNGEDWIHFWISDQA